MKNYNKYLNRFISLLCAFLFFSSYSFAQDGKALFEMNCTSCHAMGSRLVGPDLVGVGDRTTEDWMISFIKNPKKLIDSGDEYAVKIFNEYNKLQMTPFEGALSDDEVKAIVSYLVTAKAAAPPPPPVKTESKLSIKKAPVEVPMSANSKIAIYLTIGFMIIFVLIFLVVLFTIVDFIINKSEDVSKENLFVRLVYVLYGDYSVLSGNMDGEVMEDHEYDGIQELDNGMPPWLAYVFYATIISAVIYLFHYQILKTGDDQMKEYETELAEAALLYPEKSIDIKILKAESELQAGNEIFQKNCMACHGKLGEGGVGPNLTDEYWIHGGEIESIFKTIKEGVPSKGMIPWGTKLSDHQMLQTASFIMTLKGTNPPNAKKAEGEKE